MSETFGLTGIDIYEQEKKIEEEKPQLESINEEKPKKQQFITPIKKITSMGSSNMSSLMKRHRIHSLQQGKKQDTTLPKIDQKMYTADKPQTIQKTDSKIRSLSTQVINGKQNKIKSIKEILELKKKFEDIQKRRAKEPLPQPQSASFFQKQYESKFKNDEELLKTNEELMRKLQENPTFNKEYRNSINAQFQKNQTFLIKEMNFANSVQHQIVQKQKKLEKLQFQIKLFKQNITTKADWKQFIQLENQYNQISCQLNESLEYEKTLQHMKDQRYQNVTFIKGQINAVKNEIQQIDNLIFVFQSQEKQEEQILKKNQKSNKGELKQQEEKENGVEVSIDLGEKEEFFDEEERKLYRNLVLEQLDQQQTENQIEYFQTQKKIKKERMLKQYKIYKDDMTEINKIYEDLKQQVDEYQNLFNKLYKITPARGKDLLNIKQQFTDKKNNLLYQQQEYLEKIEKTKQLISQYKQDITSLVCTEENEIDPRNTNFYKNKSQFEKDQFNFQKLNSKYNINFKSNLQIDKSNSKNFLQKESMKNFSSSSLEQQINSQNQNNNENNYSNNNNTQQNDSSNNLIQKKKSQESLIDEVDLKEKSSIQIKDQKYMGQNNIQQNSENQKNIEKNSQKQLGQKQSLSKFAPANNNNNQNNNYQSLNNNNINQQSKKAFGNDKTIDENLKIQYPQADKDEELLNSAKEIESRAELLERYEKKKFRELDKLKHAETTYNKLRNLLDNICLASGKIMYQLKLDGKNINYEVNKEDLPAELQYLGETLELMKIEIEDKNSKNEIDAQKLYQQDFQNFESQFVDSENGNNFGKKNSKNSFQSQSQIQEVISVNKNQQIFNKTYTEKIPQQNSSSHQKDKQSQNEVFNSQIRSYQQSIPEEVQQKTELQELQQQQQEQQNQKSQDDFEKVTQEGQTTIKNLSNVDDLNPTQKPSIFNQQNQTLKSFNQDGQLSQIKQIQTFYSINQKNLNIEKPPEFLGLQNSKMNINQQEIQKEKLQTCRKQKEIVRNYLQKYDIEQSNEPSQYDYNINQSGLYFNKDIGTFKEKDSDIDNEEFENEKKELEKDFEYQAMQIKQKQMLKMLEINKQQQNKYNQDKKQQKDFYTTKRFRQNVAKIQEYY